MDDQDRKAIESARDKVRSTLEGLKRWEADLNQSLKKCRNLMWWAFFRGACFGVMLYFLIWSLWQDVLGLEGYIEYVKRIWVEPDTWKFWVSAVVNVTLLVLQYHMTAKDVTAFRAVSFDSDIETKDG